MFPRIRRILVPLDFGPSSDHTLGYARALAIDFRASLHLMHVVEDRLLSNPWPNDVFNGSLRGLREGLIKDAEELLSDCERAARINGLGITSGVSIGAPAQAIVETAGKVDADLIVMGAHRWTEISDLFTGSVTERVVRHAPCPVLVVGHRKAASGAQDTVLGREWVSEGEDSPSLVSTR
jgi:nucleotide-binding universal stress UspA family protein